MSVTSIRTRNSLMNSADAQTADTRPTFRRPRIVLPVPTPASKFQKAQPGVPDTRLTREATGLLHEFSTPLLFNHSHRVFFWANELGRRAGYTFDAELLFVCAAFHDLACWRSSAAPMTASRWIAQTPSGSSLSATTFPRPEFKWPGTQSLCTPLRVSRPTNQSRWSFSTMVSDSTCWVSVMSVFQKI